MRCVGYEFDVNTVAYYDVAMAKKKNMDEIEDEAFMAVDHIFDKERNVKVIRSDIEEVKREKYFDYVQIKFELLINVVEHTHTDARIEAEDVVRQCPVPVGVKLYECEAYDSERDPELLFDEEGY